MSKPAAIVAVIVLSCAAFAQQPMPSAAPVDVQSLISRIDQTAQAAALDIARLRIERWKTEKDVRAQSQANSDSISRNLSNALPTLTSAVRTSPQDFAANFKLYRNLNALYDVMKSLTESAGAFGPKEDYQSIGQYTASIDEYRRSLGDYLENLSAAKDQELVKLRAAAGSSSTHAKSGRGANKIIIDDNAPVKKTTKKKKPH